LIEGPLWVWEGDTIPRTVREASLSEERLKSCVNSQGATYRVIAALLRREGALDFLTGEAIAGARYFSETIENHHIFPQKWCKQQRISRSRYNSIVNKTPLTLEIVSWEGLRRRCMYL